MKDFDVWVNGCISWSPICITGKFAVTNPLVARPPEAEERRLWQWLNGGSRAGEGQQGFTVNCEGGRLSVTVDRSILQVLTFLKSKLEAATNLKQLFTLWYSVVPHISALFQSLSVPVAAVTLRDLTCQAESNGSHFLLVFPVISCGTEGLLLGEPRGVQYKNTVR